MKYQSELIKEIVDSRGHEKSSLHYESECTETWIEEAKGAYPKLCDYESEWLNYISVLDDTGGGEDQEPPIGEFPYIVLSDVTEATIDNVVPYAYKSAILNGCTMLLDEIGNECDIHNAPKVSLGAYISETTGEEIATDSGCRTVYFIKCPTTTFRVRGDNKYKRIIFYDENKKFISGINCGSTNNATYTVDLTKIPAGAVYLRISASLNSSGATYTPSKEIFIEDTKGNSLYLTELVSVKMPVFTTSNEDGTNTNILTVNEPVELRGIGDVKDELDLLTGKLTQRIDEDGSTLTQKVVRTVDLSIQDQDGKTLSVIKPIEGKMFLSTSSDTIKPLFSGEIPVEAITQNLASFINMETEE